MERNKEDKPWLIESVMAMQIATGFYALKALGKAFNFYALNLAFEKQLRWTVPDEAKKFLHQSIIEINQENVQGYISNLKYEDLFSDMPGLNVITCGPEITGEMTYLGFGSTLFKDGPKTKVQIYEELATHLCYDPVTESLEEKQLVLRNQLENTPQDFYKRMDEAQRKNPVSMFSFAFEISEELKQKVLFRALSSRISYNSGEKMRWAPSSYGDADIAKEMTEYMKYEMLNDAINHAAILDDAQQKNPVSMVSCAFEISEELKLEIQPSALLPMLEPKGGIRELTSTYGDTDIAKGMMEFTQYNQLVGAQTNILDLLSFVPGCGSTSSYYDKPALDQASMGSVTLSSKGVMPSYEDVEIVKATEEYVKYNIVNDAINHAESYMGSTSNYYNESALDCAGIDTTPLGGAPGQNEKLLSEAVNALIAQLTPITTIEPKAPNCGLIVVIFALIIEAIDKQINGKLFQEKKD